MTARFFLLPLFVLVFWARQVQAQETISLDAPIQFYLVEKTGVGDHKKTISPSLIRGLFIKQFREAGFHLLDDLEPPLVSQSMLRYAWEREGGVPASGIGYVHLSLADTDAVHYLSDSGQEVSLKSDPQSVDWLFEKKKALEMADKAGAKYALVVEVDGELSYQGDSPQPVYNVILSADLYEADNGKDVFNHQESMVKLASTPQKAVEGACQFLSQRLVEKTQEGVE